MRVFTTLPQEDLRKVGPAARAIEAAGYTGVSTQENRHDPFLALAVAGVATQKIELHTGVAISFPRSPMVAANVGWDIQAGTGGRFTLGLGSQIRAHNEKRFSVPWTPPGPRMREYIQAVRAIWTAWKGDGKLAYEGKHYRFTLMTPNCRAGELCRAGAAHRARRRRPRHAEGGGGGERRHKLHISARAVSREPHHADPDGGSRRVGPRAGDFRDLGRRLRRHRQDDLGRGRAAGVCAHRVAFYGSTPAYWPFGRRGWPTSGRSSTP